MGHTVALLVLGFPMLFLNSAQAKQKSCGRESKFVKSE